MSDGERFDSWCVLELLGHRRLAGRVTEEERFGVKLGRIDVPIAGTACKPCKGSGRVPDVPEVSNPDHIVCNACDGHGEIGQGFTTVYFGGSSVYALTPTTEEAARAVARRNQPEPVHQWELPKPEVKPVGGGPLDFDPEGYESDRDDDDADFPLPI